MRWIIPGLIISYLLGSIPTGYLFARFKGIDIRKRGSGNIGATNVLRVLGKKYGAIVLMVDIIKGIVPVILLGDFLISRQALIPQDLLRLILGGSAVIGHSWNFFLGFKGGKGVATTFGVLIGSAIRIQGFALILTIVALVWFIVFLFSKIVSLASICASLSFPLSLSIFKQTMGFSSAILVFGGLAAFLVIFRHRSNIKRLLKGEEPRIRRA